MALSMTVLRSQSRGGHPDRCRRDPAGHPRTGSGGRGPALLATALGFGVVQLDVSAVNVAIRLIGADLGGSIAGLQWVVTAYTLVFAASILSAGALGDRLGAKRLFASGFAMFTAASVGCGLAPTLGLLIAARALQGVGAAVLVPCSLALLNRAYPGTAERARAVGLWAACGSMALAAGPLVGGLLTAVLGWRAIFFINLPLGALGIWLTARYTVETPASGDRGLDVRGQTLAVLTLLLLAGATILGGQRGFAAAPVLAGYAAAVVAGVTFVLVEARRAQPMLPLRLFRSRTFSAATAIGLAVSVAFYGLIFVLSLYFQTVRSFTVLGTGLAFVPTTVAVGAGNLLASRLTARAGTRTVLAGSGALIAASLAGLLGTGATTPFPALVGQLVALGLGLGVLVPAMTAALLGSAPATRSGVASGTLNTARQTGSVLGVALFGSLAAGHLVAGLHAALLISIGLAVAITGLAALVEKEPAA
jgi:DHA2 family methylenomycin A resistance protein-like MFS transporter